MGRKLIQTNIGKRSGIKTRNRSDLLGLFVEGSCGVGGGSVLLRDVVVMEELGEENEVGDVHSPE